jgi:hypothetical protein
MVRSPNLPEVDLADLKYDDAKTVDQHFQKLYKSYCTGKLVAVFTRVDIRKVYVGNYERSNDGSVNRYDYRADKKHIEWMAYDIRRGFRPSLYLYNGVFGETVDGFVCSDDVLAYYGYKKLGIRYVPAIVLGRSSKFIGESGIRIKIEDGREKFVGLAVKNRTVAATFLGPDSDLKKCDPLKAVRLLRTQAMRAARCIVAFHIRPDDAVERQSPELRDIHYHHCLHAVAFRLAEVLRAIDVLIRGGLEYQIRPLVRSAYELFLNFYVDWLFPEKVGLVLQALAQLDRMDRNGSGYLSLKKSVDATFGGLADVCRNVSEKGRMSPLGADMHHQIYSSLSPIVHQDFGVAHEYASILEAGRHDKMDHRELMSHIRCLDLITAAAVLRLVDDVGSPKGRRKEWPALKPSRLRWVGVRRNG